MRYCLHEAAGSSELLFPNSPHGRDRDANGVRAAMIVQPINLGFDHTYVERALETHANRFVGMCLANPSAGDAGVEALEKLLAGRFRGVRFNPGLWPNGKGMDGEIGRKMMRACAARTPPGAEAFSSQLLYYTRVLVWRTTDEYGRV